MSASTRLGRAVPSPFLAISSLPVNVIDENSSGKSFGHSCFQRKKNSTSPIVDPTGVPARTEMKIPTVEQETENAATILRREAVVFSGVCARICQTQT